VRGDCLAWNDWVPIWLTDIVRNRPPGWQDALGHIYEDNFKKIFAHFGKLESTSDFKLLRWCGLVNEPFNPWVISNGSPSWRKGAWLDAFGIENDDVPGYIHRAFALGERYGSGSLSLFINETNCDNDRFGPLVRPALLRLVDALQRSGKRIDAVGLECHLMPQWMKDPANPDWKPFVVFLRELQKRNVEIYITELDVNDCSLRDAAQRDAQVANYMHSLVNATLEVPAVTMVTNWDLSDKYSWLRSDAVYPSLSSWADCGARPPCPRPDLYDQTMRPKIARDSLATALKGSR
jgi:endo-1,4-beta-xylanase